MSASVKALLQRGCACVRCVKEASQCTPVGVDFVTLRARRRFTERLFSFQDEATAAFARRPKLALGVRARQQEPWLTRAF